MKRACFNLGFWALGMAGLALIWWAIWQTAVMDWNVFLGKPKYYDLDHKLLWIYWHSLRYLFKGLVGCIAYDWALKKMNALEKSPA